MISMHDIFLKNLPYKIAALVITIFLWVFISKEKNVEIGISAKLITKTRPGLIVSGDVPNEINIKFVGPKIFLQPLMFRHLSITVDLTDSIEGETTFNILKNMIDVPWGVKVVSITPSTVIAKIEKVETKTVPIHPVFEGTPPLGYSLKSQELEPQVVQISGPKNEITSTKYINTRPIVLNNVTESFTKTFALELPSSKIVLRNIKNVKVTVTITENMSTKSFNNIKLDAYNCILRCKVSPTHISLVLKGPKELLKNLQNKDIQVYVDAASKPKGTYPSKAVIKLPARTTVEKVSPSWFKLTVF
jgi:YbbR domain-containing protein